MKFSDLASYFGRIESTSRRTEIADILADLFRHLVADEIGATLYLTQTRLGPPFCTSDLGINDRLATRAIAQATGLRPTTITAALKRQGDLGLVAERVVHTPSTGASILDVFTALNEIARTAGAGSQTSKVDRLADLLRRLDGQEAKYVVRIVLGRLRLGVGDPTLIDALSRAVQGGAHARKEIARAYNVTSDLGLVARVLLVQGTPALHSLHAVVGRPVRPALAERLSTPAEIVGRLGRVLVEPKYDGLRLQVHRHGSDVTIFTRRLENVTDMFPEIVAAALDQINVPDAIIDGEAVGFNPETGEYVPFQVTAHRRRVHKVEEMSQRYPLRLFAFDLLHASGRDYTDRPLSERRDHLQHIIRQTPNATIVVSPGILTSDATELTRFFDDAVASGLEGILAKRPNAPYRAGERSYDWVKLKRGYQAKLKDTVDTVLVGYIIGKGNRARFGIGSLLSAVYDPDHDRFRTVAKIGSGVTEEQWVQLKALLDKYAVNHRPARVDSIITPDVWVEPHYVVEVYADEISRSPVHTAGKRDGQPGYALRFPRLVRWIRSDKRPEDATTEEEILKLYALQRSSRAA